MACSKKVEHVDEVRPVKVLKIAADNIEIIAEFPGEVRAHVESRLGFRVGGKVISRKVDIGSTVRRGQILMQLDSEDLRLVQRQAEAALKSALSNRDLAVVELQRYEGLRERNFVSQAALDGKKTAYESALSSYEQAMAVLRNQVNQTSYANLVADVDGVVISVDAEVGQVVAAGTPVISVAKAGGRDVVIGVPENQVDMLRRADDVRVCLWANPKEVIVGKIREVSPIADAATRTYAFKIAVPDTASGVKLGMTAYATFAVKTTHPQIKLPLTALHSVLGKTSVWLVENGVVKLVPVKVAGQHGNNVLIAEGLESGQIVVTAGVNLLKPGQRVKILEDDSVVQDNKLPCADHDVNVTHVDGGQQ